MAKEKNKKVQEEEYSIEDLIARGTFLSKYDKFWDSLYKEFPHYSEKHIMVSPDYQIFGSILDLIDLDKEYNPMFEHAYLIPETLEIKEIDKISFVDDLLEFNEQNNTKLFAVLEFDHRENNISYLKIFFFEKWVSIPHQK